MSRKRPRFGWPAAGVGAALLLAACAPGGGGETTTGDSEAAVPPSAPTGLSITAGDAQVTLTWNPVSGAASYNLYWSTSAGAGLTEVTKATGTKIEGVTGPYIHSGLTNGTTYYYVVTAVSAGGESAESAEVSVTPLPPPPSAPTGVTITGGDGQVTLTWDVVSGATGYNLYMATQSGVTKDNYATLTGGMRHENVGSPFTHTGLQNGTPYYFVLTAVNAGGESAESAEVSATPQVPAPGAPVLTATAGVEQVTLTWSAVSGATGYKLYWANAPGVTKTSGTPIAGVTSPHPHSSLTAGTFYYYVLTAVNPGGESAESAEVGAMPVGVSGSLDKTFGLNHDVVPPAGVFLHHNAAGGDAYDAANAVAIDSAGRMVVVGYSDRPIDPGVEDGASDLAIWRINPDGTLDKTFGGKGYVTHHNAAGGEGSDVGNAVAIDQNGKIVVTGSSVPTGGGCAILTLWRFNTDGTLDSEFGGVGFVSYDPGQACNSQGNAIAIDSGGKLVVAGGIGSDMGLWRVHPNGALDDTGFGTNGVVIYDSTGQDNGFAVAIATSGKIVVAGASNREHGGVNAPDMALWRFDADGTPDTTFGISGVVTHHNAVGDVQGGAADAGFAVALDGEGKIVVTGYSQYFGSDTDMVVWRFTSTGVLDNFFSGDGIATHHNAAAGGGSDGGEAVAIDSSTGRILVAGTSYGGSSNGDDLVLWAFTSAGVLDTTFGGDDGLVTYTNPAASGQADHGHAVALTGGGRIVVAGHSDNQSDEDMALWVFTSAGVLDTSFHGEYDAAPDGWVIFDESIIQAVSRGFGQGVAIDGAGRILVVGYLEGAPGNSMMLWRFLPNGTPDMNFNSQGYVFQTNAYGTAVAVDSAGRYVVAGYSPPAGNYDLTLWRFNENGTLDTSFNYPDGYVTHDLGLTESGDDYPQALAIDNSGRIVVAGYGPNASLNQDMVLWRFTSAGALDTSFGEDHGDAGTEPDGWLAHHNAAGGNGDDLGHAVAIDASNRIIVAGESDGSTTSWDMVLWRFTDTGVLDNQFDNDGIVTHHNAAGKGANDFANAMAIDSNGNIIVTGRSGDGVDDDMVIWRFTNTGAPDPLFDTDGVAIHHNAAGGARADEGWAVAVDGAGRILVAGHSEANLTRDLDLALWRFTATGALDTTFGPDRDGNGSPDGWVTDDTGVHFWGQHTVAGHALALDAAGRIVVAGQSCRNIAPCYDDMTLWRFWP